MNTRVREIFDRSEGRYLSDSEEATLLGYAETLVQRLDAMQAVERAEREILDDVVRAVIARFPDMVSMYGEGADSKVRRDQAMVLRYAASAMVLQDENFIYDKLAVWLRVILYALCRPEHVLVGYSALIDGCRRHLSEPDAEAIVPFIRVLVAEFENNAGGASPGGASQ